MGDGGWPGVGKCIGESASGTDSGVSRGDFSYGIIVGKKINSVDNAVRSGLQDVYSVAPIFFRVANDVSSSDSIGCPGAANSRGFKDDNVC